MALSVIKYFHSPEDLSRMSYGPGWDGIQFHAQAELTNSSLEPICALLAGQRAVVRRVHVEVLLHDWNTACCSLGSKNSDLKGHFLGEKTIRMRSCRTELTKTD